MSTRRHWFGLILLPLVVLVFHLSLPPFTVSVAVTPDGTLASTTAHATGWSEAFVVKNTGTGTTTFNLSCAAAGQITCISVDQSQVTLGAGSQVDVEVTFSTGNVSGQATNRIKLVASGSGAVDTGYYRVNVSTSVIRLVSPGDDTVSTRIVVHNRQPVVRAIFLNSSGYSTDTTATVLKWRDTVITSLARHNRGLLEWEVDSTRWLGLGDSAKITVQQTANGVTSTETRWAVLLNDNNPVIGFAGMPLEALNGSFSSSFGPGFSVTGAEVETGFSAVPYQSLGAARSAGLMYSTRTSYPRALINADIEIPWPAGTPDNIKVYLWDASVKMDSAILTSPSLTPCTQGSFKRCRVTLQADFSGSAITTPTRKWLKVEVLVTSGSVKSALDSVEVVLVDRRTTQYGSGWWPSGISRLYALGAPSGNDRVLIGPSGSATIFRGNGDSLYVSPPGSFTTLVKTSGGWELRPRGSNARVRFDTNGRIIATADANGNTDSVTYASTTDTVTSLIDPVGKTITFTYTSGKLSKITTLTGGAARDLFVNIDGSNQLTYYRLPFTVSSATANRDTVRFSYQSYPGTGTYAITKHIGLISDTTRIVYDSTFLRRPVQVYLPSVQDEAGASVTPDVEYFAYERQGFHALRSLDSVYVEIKDPRDNWTRSLLNRWALTRKTWDALGLIGKTQYDADGFSLWSEGKNGDSSRTYTVYDGYKRVVKSYIIRAAGDTLRGDSLVYDGNHRVIKTIDNRGKSDSTAYDANGNLIYSKDKAGNVTTMAYMSDGRVDSIIQPGAQRQKLVYETTWRQVSRIRNAALDTVTYHWYDQYGRDSLTQDKTRVQVTSTMSLWQWRQSRVYLTLANQADSTILLRTDNCNDPCNSPPSWPTLTDTVRTQHVRLVRDRAGRDSLRKDDRGIATMYVLDGLGRLTSRRPWTDSMAVKDSMVYDVVGNLRKTITRRGHTIQTWYDSRNRDTTTSIPGIGDLKRAFGGPLDQVTRIFYANEADSIGGVNREVRWGFDQRGRLKADTAFTGTTARQTSYTYDTYERVSGMTDASGAWQTLFDANLGLPTTVMTPFADTIIYGYDDHLRPTGPTINSSGPRQILTPGWFETGLLDSVAQRVSTSPSSFTPLTYHSGASDEPSFPSVSPFYAEQHGAGTAVDTLRDSVQFDGWERVTAWVGARNGSVVSRDTFSFDRMGNIKTTAGTEVYHSITGRLLTRNVAGWTDSMWYDRAGNLDSVKSKKGAATKYWGYDYDVLNRLVTVRLSGTLIARYSYDVLGRRIAKRVYSANSGGVVRYSRFVYHGDQEAFEADSGPSGGTIKNRYTWGMDTDNMLAVQDSTSTTYYTVKDKLGSIRGLVKRDGTWKYSERFGPYGAQVEFAGTDIGLRYRWTGREYDTETGFYYFRARYYEPAARRFVQEDPIGYGGGGNLYAYVAGQVLEARDPTGLLLDDPLGEMWWDPGVWESSRGLATNKYVTGAGCYCHGGRGFIDNNSDGRDDFDEFAEYANGRFAWNQAGGTTEAWNAIQWSIDHDFADEQAAEAVRYALAMGWISPRNFSANPPSRDYPNLSEEEKGILDASMAVTDGNKVQVFLNTSALANSEDDYFDVSDLRNSLYLALVLAHEIYHLRLGAPSPLYGTPGYCQEERAADRYALTAVGLTGGTQC